MKITAHGVSVPYVLVITTAVVNVRCYGVTRTNVIIFRYILVYLSMLVGISAATYKVL